RIEQIGTPLDLYNHPANLFVAGFIGAPRMNLLPVKLTPGGTGRSSLTLDGSAGFEIDGNVSAANSDVTLGLRPHHIGLADAGKGDIAASVALVEALGSETIVHAKISSGRTMLAVVAGQCSVASGDTVDLKFDTSHLHLFDNTGLRIAVS
ncbi:MAG: TOBE domain-containing protein, partial [Mesorhizobium sp.]